MSLDVLAKKLDENELHYSHRPDGSLLLPIQGRYVVHPFVVTEEARGCLRVSVAYPVPRVADIPGLCDELNKFLQLAQVAPTDAGRMLTLSIYSTSGEAGEDVEVLSAYADDVHALLEHLRDAPLEPGMWDTNLVGLALLEPEECDGRA